MMSSILGHAATGAAIYLAYNRLNGKQAFWALPVLVVLAICPDVDYLAIWLFKAMPTVRITHSLLFGICTASLAWLCSAAMRQKHQTNLPFYAFLVASLSHPVLDLLVGVHPVPLLWPLPNSNVSPPFGILPSAGRLALGNYYLWRNLLIELAILLPVLTFLVAFMRHVPWRTIAARAFVIAPVWLFFVMWSIGLQR